MVNLFQRENLIYVDIFDKNGLVDLIEQKITSEEWLFQVKVYE